MVIHLLYCFVSLRTPTFAILALTGLFLFGCTPQISSKASHTQLSLSALELQEGGIAFITPSTVTGQEEEKQAVAFVFASTLMNERPDLRIVPLPETLSIINRAGLTNEYKQMFQEYKDTGIFSRQTLSRIAEASGARYLAQLKLAGFSQRSSNRFGVFGLRMIETKSATIRLFFQLWDGRLGVITWEGVQELSWSEEKIAEAPITLQTLMDKAAKDIAARLPR
ncbi:MAG: hypothetical protein HKP41_06680 [Desulfobacterales bacterium]|nr:hypothetical protein [Desulfobacterales bacterium]